MAVADVTEYSVQRGLDNTMNYLGLIIHVVEVIYFIVTFFLTLADSLNCDEEMLGGSSPRWLLSGGGSSRPRAACCPGDNVDTMQTDPIANPNLVDAG